MADRPVVVSFKLPPNEVVAGVHDAALTDWFSSIPRGEPMWWAYFHEPEDDIERGAFTATEFREAFRRISALARTHAPRNVQSALILQCRTTKPQFGRDFADYDPGSATYDVMGFDCYNREVREGNYPSAAAFLAPLLEVADRVGRPLGLAEFGSQVVPGDDGTARARWLEEVSAALIERDSPFVTYFDSPITGTDYRLEDDPSRAAWRHIVTGES